MRKLFAKIFIAINVLNAKIAIMSLFDTSNEP